MVDFAGNPAGATPIAPASLVVDDCGRFRATDLEPPSLGFAAVTVDDAMGTTDRHRLTTIAALEGAPDPETNRSLRAYVTRSATDVAWSTGAGLVGPTFADRGVIVANFRYQGAGHAGVTIIRNGMASAPDDHYFSDVDASRTTIDPGASATGTNGTALFLGSSLVEHSGQGGQPVGCQWPSSLAAATAGVVFFVPMDAETNTGLPCP